MCIYLDVLREYFGISMGKQVYCIGHVVEQLIIELTSFLGQLVDLFLYILDLGFVVFELLF